MSRAYKDLTDDERKALAQMVHARNRLAKISRIIKVQATHLKTLRAEKKRLEQVVKAG